MDPLKSYPCKAALRIRKCEASQQTNCLVYCANGGPPGPLAQESLWLCSLLTCLNLFLKFRLMLGTFSKFLKRSQRVPPARTPVMAATRRPQNAWLHTEAPRGPPNQPSLPGCSGRRRPRGNVSPRRSHSTGQNGFPPLKAHCVRVALTCKAPAHRTHSVRSLHREQGAEGQGFT